MSIRLLLLSAARFHMREPLQLLLSITGIALGVAVYVGVDIANTSATAAFESSAQFVRGATTHRLLPASEFLDEQLYSELIAEHGIPGAPIIELPVTTSSQRTPATLLGIDPIEEAGFRETTRLAMLGGTAPADLITVPGTAVVSAAVATPESETVLLSTPTGDHELLIVGRIPEAASTDRIVVVDITTAQEIANMIGGLSRIDLILTADQARTVQAALPADTVLLDTATENAAFSQLSNAFRINILALGLLALAIGMFLVYSCSSFSLVRRTKTHVVFNTLGAARADLALAIGMEFTLIATIASLIGVALGHSLANLLVDMMLFTIEDFSFRREAAVGNVSMLHYAQGLGIGIAATLLAAIAPIRHAIRRDTATTLKRSTLERSSMAWRQRGLWLAIVCALASVVLLRWPGGSLIVAFAGLFAVLAACALATPAAMQTIVAALQVVAKPERTFVAGMAARNVSAQQSRLAVATAALTLAVSCVVGVGLMIDSFRSSLLSWLDTTLTSDVYVNFSSDEITEDDLPALLHNDDRLASFSVTRIARVPTEFGLVTIRAFRPGLRGWGIETAEGASISLAQPDMTAAIAITEPFALRTGLRAGDALTLPGVDGAKELPIAAVYRNYDAGGAGVLMNLATFQALRDDLAIDGIGLEVRNPQDIAEIAAVMRELYPAGAARITSSSGIRQISVEIFDRTFLITEVLRLLAGSVAFFGMLSALMAIQISRKREFAVLRSLGFDTNALRRLILTETAIVGSGAGLVALPVGALLAALLIYVINVRSFGWTMNFETKLLTFAPGFALGLIAALLAGFVAAVFSCRQPIRDAIRH